MTREEFEHQFNTLVKTDNYADFHSHVLRNLHKMSDEALHFIVDNAGNPFGDWLVQKAVDLTVFEDIVLKGEHEHKGPRRKTGTRNSSRRVRKPGRLCKR